MCSKLSSDGYKPYSIPPKSDFCSSTNPVENNYLPQWGFFFGYPASLNKTSSSPCSPVSDVSHYTAFMSKLNLTFSFENSGRNIAFHYCQKTKGKELCIDLMDRKKDDNLPLINCMSGSAIWSFPDYPDIMNFDKIKYELCGLLTTFHPEENTIIGFSLNDIIQMLPCVVSDLQKHSTNEVIYSVRP